MSGAVPFGVIEVTKYSGPRSALDALFAEADDSEIEIAGYKGLGEVLVAVDQDEIVGHVQIIASDGFTEIKSIAVHEDRRSQGIGTKLVQAALDRCRETEAGLVRVATAAASTDALKFYQRQGFRISRIIRDFYVAERGYRAYILNGIPLLDEVILELEL